jgi:hypothetical protein
MRTTEESGKEVRDKLLKRLRGLSLTVKEFLTGISILKTDFRELRARWRLSVIEDVDDRVLAQTDSTAFLRRLCLQPD